nr:uncharacterized protein LOC129271724 [Lytechinus pictus]
MVRTHFERNYTWSNYNNTLFESESCIHQQVRNGWRKLPCTSYLRFACEKPSHRFEVRSEKTNPGVSKFSCSYTKSWRPDLLPEYVKAAVGMLSEDNLINHTSANSSRNSVTSYFYESIGREEPIYCFVGDPKNSSGFAFISVPTGDFFALPNYTGTPKIIESGYNHAVVRWRQWNPETDTGDGPIVGYKIYVRSDTEIVLDEKVQPPWVTNSSEQVVSKRSAQNSTDITYNVTELEAGSTYAIQIAAIRDGIKGEGKQGPPLYFTTESRRFQSCFPSPHRSVSSG